MTEKDFRKYQPSFTSVFFLHIHNAYLHFAKHYVNGALYFKET